jgi:hypothetical protein
MKAISIQLEPTEQETLQHHAEALGVDSGDIAYIALNRLMVQLKTHPEISHEIIAARDRRYYQDPVWSGVEHSAHPFDDGGNDYAVPGL